MFGKNRMLGWSGGIAVAASLAVIAAPSALGARAHTQACQAGTNWVSLTDEQGIPNLEQLGQTTCLASLACTSSDEATSSPYPGWVSVTDETGVPWLYPAGSSLSLDRQTCTPAPAPPAADAATAGKPAAAPSQPIIQSPYPGWIYVTDDRGVAWLIMAGS